VQHLSSLFARFASISTKYTEPSEVLRALVDDFGQPLQLGDQKDIGEFNLNFLERIEEGLGERRGPGKEVPSPADEFEKQLEEY